MIQTWMIGDDEPTRANLAVWEKHHEPARDESPVGPWRSLDPAQVKSQPIVGQTT